MTHADITKAASLRDDLGDVFGEAEMGSEALVMDTRRIPGATVVSYVLPDA